MGRSVEHRSAFSHALAAFFAVALVLGLVAVPTSAANAAPVSHVVDGITFEVNEGEPGATASVVGYDIASGVAVVIPETVEIGGVSYPVGSIAERAFYELKITSVVIPNSVTSIGPSAFERAALSSLIIPDSVTELGATAFGSNQLTSITIGAGVATLPSRVFMANPLTQIALPSTLKVIGSEAFWDCELTSIDVPDSVTTIEMNAFQENALTSAKLPVGLTELSPAVLLLNDLTELEIPSSVTSIGFIALMGNDLASVTIPAAVTSIDGAAFRENTNLTRVVFEGDAPTVLPGGVTSGSLLQQESFPSASATLYYYCSANGFTAPTWNGYNTVGQCVVKFDGNGGSPIPGDTVVTTGEKIDAPTTEPTRDGYSFTGWYSDSAATTSFDFDAPIADDVTIYAGWAPTSYEVTFDSQGGSAVDPATVEHGSAVAKPADPTREGYAFTGWFTDAGAAVGTEYDFDAAVTGDLILFAGWALNSYTVTFDSQGGSAVDPATVEHGSAVAKPADPTREGHSFTGWFTDVGAAAGTEYDFAAGVTGDLTLFAGWKLNEYTVTFDSQGGSAVDSATVEHGEAVAKPADPTREGYSFTGWFTDAGAAEGTEYDFDAAVTGDLTVFAGWQLNEYTVTFDSQGGSAVDSATVEHGSPVAKPADPTREGYAFTGWFTDAGAAAGTEYDFDAAVTGDLTLFAGWQLNEYTVVFDSQGGSAVDSATVEHGEAVAKPADPTREGYAFTGWFTDAGAVAGSEYDFDAEVTGDLTLFAGWALNSYTVTFDSQGGSAVDSATVEHGEAVAKPVDPTREGYSFTGWFTDAGTAAGSEYDFDAPVTGDLTLFAGWQLNEYTVTYDSQGGSAVDSATVEYGEAVSKPADPTREGYAFTGWFTDAATAAGTEYDFDAPVTGDLTLFAGWALNSYTVTFESQGGSAVDSATVEHGETVAKPADPTREGHSFTGWFTDAGAAEGNEYDFDAAVTGDLTLFAGWALNSYTVAFDSQGGSAVDSATVEHGSAVVKPADPTREGHSFTGWFTDAGAAAGTEYDFAAGVTGDLTLFAGWKLNEYTVSFDSQGGSAVDSATVEHGETVAKPADPTRVGYSFTGWFTDAGTGAGTEYDFDAAVTGDLTLFAGWKLNQYTVTFDSQGGSAVDSATVEHGEAVVKPADPTSEGYAFTGWFTDAGAAAGSEYDFDAAVTGDLTLFAGWKLNEYTVSFDSQGGSAVDSATVEHGSAVAKPADPTLEGYAFTGWFTDAGAAAGSEYDFDAAVTGDLTLFAGWALNSYTVSFDSQEGTAVPSVTVEHGEAVSKPADPTREGYAFTGWFTDAGAVAGSEYDFDAAVTGNLTLFAGWQLNEYTVAFDSQGGSDVSPASVFHGTPVAKPADPTREGYVFTGWFTDAGAAAGTEYDFDEAVTGDLTLFAGWALNSYTVTFDSQGGSAVDSAAVEHGSPVGKPADPTLEGYAFTGWFTDAGASEGSEYDFDAAVTGDLTLFAGWALNSYTVTFDSQGGSAVDSATVEHGEAVAKPADPTLEGYSFTGWFTDAGAAEGTEYDFAGAVTGDLTLFAGWQLNEYTVAFDSQGGTAVDSATVEHGSAVAKPADPTLEGYAFTGWFTDAGTAAGSEYDFDAAVTGNLTLFAGWQLNEYTVAFDSQGGSDVSPASVFHGTPVAKPADPTREGYVFTGWFTDAGAAAGTEYDFDEAVTGDLTLFAGWALNSYTVTFDSQGGTAVDSATVEHGEAVAKPAAPTREGYSFTGWFADTGAAAGSEYDFDAPVIGDLTLFAGWKLNGYTVAFDSQGGSAVDAATVEHGEAVAKPADPTREGYAFTGWFTEAGATEGTEYDFDSPVTGDLTVFAGWKLNDYTVAFDSQGGSAVDSATVEHGETVAKPADPTREGHTFTVWYTKAEAAAGATYDFATPVTGDLTLFAGWKLNEYTVSFDSQQGSGVASVTVAHGDTVAKPADPTREGYRFAGWFTDADGKHPFAFTDPVTGEITLFALWEKVSGPPVQPGEGGGKPPTGAGGGPVVGTGSAGPMAALAAGFVALLGGALVLLRRRGRQVS